MNPQSNPVTETTGRRKAQLGLGLIALAPLVMALLAGACAPGATPTPAPTDTPAATNTPVLPSPTAAPVGTAEATLGGPTPTPFAVPEALPSKGDPEAKVVIIEFGDYQ